MNHAEHVIAELTRVTDVAAITPDMALDDLHLTSEATLRLLMALEKRFGVTIDIVDLFTAEKVDELIALAAPASEGVR